MEQKDSHAEPERRPSSDGGLYKNVNISVRTLDFLIVAGLLGLVALFVLGINNPGYHVTFDANGGTDVSYQVYNWQDPLHLPDNPSREGYLFQGWYLDERCLMPADEGMPVESDLLLYAKWSQKQE